MRMTFWRMFLLTTLLCLYAVFATAADGITVSPKASFAPATVIVRARVEHDSRNRAMCLELDGGLYRSSCWEIDGDSPLVTEQVYRDLPGGTYTVRLTITRQAVDKPQTVVFSDTACVIGRNEASCEGSSTPDSLSD